MIKIPNSFIILFSLKIRIDHNIFTLFLGLTLQTLNNLSSCYLPGPVAWVSTCTLLIQVILTVLKKIPKIIIFYLKSIYAFRWEIKQFVTFFFLIYSHYLWLWLESAQRYSSSVQSSSYWSKEQSHDLPICHSKHCRRTGDSSCKKENDVDSFSRTTW